MIYATTLNRSFTTPEPGGLLRLPNPWPNCLNKDVGRLVLTKKITGEQKDWLADEFIHHGQTYTDLSKRYSISRVLLRQWVCRRRNRQGGLCGVKRKLQATGGRPDLLTPEQKERYFKEAVELETKGSLNKTASRCNNIINALAAENASSRGVKRRKVEVSRRTIARIDAELGVKVGSAEVGTSAREKAQADIVNFIQFLAMNYWFLEIEKIKSGLLFNCDSTQSNVACNSSVKILAKYCDNNGGRSIKVSAEDGKAKHGLAFSIKSYWLHNALGMVGKPVFVISDENMDEKEFHVYEINDLCMHTDVGGSGYIVFCKTRQGNEAFFKWLHIHYLIPEMSRFRNRLGFTSDKHMAFLQLDGEGCQIKPFELEEVLKAYDDHNTAAGKGPGSLTHIFQSLDNGNTFKGFKTKLLHLTEEDIRNLDELWGNVLENIKAAIKDHNQKLRSKLPSERQKGFKGMCLDHQKKLGAGLIKILTASIDSVNRLTGMNSWKNVGLRPFKTDVIFDYCSTHIPEAMRKALLSKLDTLATYIGMEGELPGKELNDILCPAGLHFANAAEKDKLCVSQRRSIIFTNFKFIQREAAKKRREIDAQIQKENAKIKASEDKKKLEEDKKKLAELKIQLRERLINGVVSFQIQNEIQNLEDKIKASKQKK